MPRLLDRGDEAVERRWFWLGLALVGCGAGSDVRPVHYDVGDWHPAAVSDARSCADRVNTAVEDYRFASQFDRWSGVVLGVVGGSGGVLGLAADDDGVQSTGLWLASLAGILTAVKEVGDSQGWASPELAQERYQLARRSFDDAVDAQQAWRAVQREEEGRGLDMRQPTWRLDISDLGKCDPPKVAPGRWVAGGAVHACETEVVLSVANAVVEDERHTLLVGTNPAPADAAGPEVLCVVQLSCIRED